MRAEKREYAVVYENRRWWRRRTVGSSAAQVRFDGSVVREDPELTVDELITPLVHTGELSRTACAGAGCYLCRVLLGAHAARDAALAAEAVESRGRDCGRDPHACSPGCASWGCLS
ncbi:hypothetical protein H7J86_24300 [Mycobacterium hackensackense]|uniref:hypothetical protein n=1 Tax=Mycobacterium hackensackense TaxID=228909 RepID=UPI002265D582|nr:hypothetical protein [Mycobacterium hackensackense]MCV7255289.1 hypothetical protein [Mycobacterium hackensackense]